MRFMKALFEPKRLLEVAHVNAVLAEDAAGYITQCEEEYAARIGAAADRIEARGASIILLTGPSASGKTTSSLKIAQEMRRRGHGASVVSLDNFFKAVADYPRHPDGSPDMEHLHALDVERINDCLTRLIEAGETEIPTFDFMRQCKSDDTTPVRLGMGDIVIIEGIHALNPELTAQIPYDKKMGIYAGLRAEYSENGRRVLATRELRITRRLVRDFYFRGHTIRSTLEMWGRLQEGEEIWIKPFKDEADILLDTSFPYEPALFAPLLEQLCSDVQHGGDFRSVLLNLQTFFGRFRGIESDLIPSNSMLREFIGKLEL